MAVVQGKDYLFEDYSSLVLIEATFGNDFIKKFTSFTEFHHQVDIPGILKRLKEFYNMRMIQVP